MARAFSDDLRQRVLAAADGGQRPRQVAERFSVSDDFVREVTHVRATTGRTTALRPKGRPKTWLAYADTLTALVAEKPDRTLVEIREALAGALSLATIHQALKALGLTLKKKSCPQRKSIEPTSPPPGPPGPAVCPPRWDG